MLSSRFPDPPPAWRPEWASPELPVSFGPDGRDHLGYTRQERERAGMYPSQRRPTPDQRQSVIGMRHAAERAAVVGVAEEELHRIREERSRELVHGDTPDDVVRRLAELRAELMQSVWGSLAVLDITPAGRLGRVNVALLELQGDIFPLAGVSEEADLLPIRARTVCAMWWRRRLRREVVRDRERRAIAAGEVCATRRQVYCTNETVTHMRRRAAAAQEMMRCTELETIDGQRATLERLARGSHTRPDIRRGELMTRVVGCEVWAKAHQHRAVFLTLTAPSRFHATLRAGGPNPAFDGSTPRDAQGWLSAQWARARAALARRGVQVYGLRVAEPHHDGCPHWHALLWAPAGQVWRLVRAIKRQWLSDGGQEPGARRHRVKAVLMAEGGAAGYVAKYIAKGIDDHGAVGAEGHADDGAEGGQAGASPRQQDMHGGTYERVRAWASAWGVRQFQAVGQPPVGVWRELRRVAEEPRITRTLTIAYLAASRDRGRRASWVDYVIAQGGMCVGRDHRIAIWWAEGERTGRYGVTRERRPLGVWDRRGPRSYWPSVRREWRPVGGWRGTVRSVGAWTDRAEREAIERPGPPWTRVYNCTRAGGPESLLRAIQARTDPAALAEVMRRMGPDPYPEGGAARLARELEEERQYAERERERQRAHMQRMQALAHTMPGRTTPDRAGV
jgi:hypothetical protein